MASVFSLYFFLASLSFPSTLEFLAILHNESFLLPVEKAFNLLLNPWFIDWEAAHLFGRYNVILTETDLLRYAMRVTLNIIPFVLLEQFPICDIETLLESRLRPH